MLCIHEEEGLQPVEERIMTLNYKTMSANDKILFLTQQMCPRMIKQHSNTPFKIVFFKPKSIKSISLLCTIMGKKNDEEVNGTPLGFLAYLHPIAKEIPIWDIYGIITQAINQPWVEFPSL